MGAQLDRASSGGSMSTPVMETTPRAKVYDELLKNAKEPGAPDKKDVAAPDSPAALDFMRSLGVGAVQEWNHALAMQGAVGKWSLETEPGMVRVRNVDSGETLRWKKTEK